MKCLHPTLHILFLPIILMEDSVLQPVLWLYNCNTKGLMYHTCKINWKRGKIILDRKIITSDALIFSHVISLPVWFYNPPKKFSLTLGIIIQNENKTLKKLKTSRRITFPDSNYLVCHVVPMADHKENWNTERAVSSSTAKPDDAGSAQSM